MVFDAAQNTSSTVLQDQAPEVSDQELSATVLTTQDRAQFISALEDFEKSLFAPGRGPEFRNQLQQLPSEFAQLIKKIIAPALQPDASPAPTHISALLKKTKEQLDALPTATLQLAYRPTVIQTRELASFLRSCVSDRLLLSLKYEPEVVGGFILECNGKKIQNTIDSFLNKLTKIN